MRKSGFTLIETVLVLFIISLISIASLSFIQFNINLFRNMEDSIDKQSNIRIAVDFVYDRIKEAKDIKVFDDEIMLDGKRVYVKNNILRYDTDSQQIACGINQIKVYEIKNNGKLYCINVSSGDFSQTTLVLNRSDYYE